MPRRFVLNLSSATAVVALSCSLQVVESAEFTPPAAFLKKFCFDCHSGPRAENDFNLESLSSDLGKADVLAKWVRAFDRVDLGEMPPVDHVQPSADEINAFITPLRDALRRASQARAETVIRRLNRDEYERTLNDLLGTAVKVADMLPEDGRAFGFDNIGESLDLSPVQLQRYMEAAGKALDATASGEPRPESKLTTYTFDSGRNADFIGKQWQKRDDGAVLFFSEGGYPAISVQEFRAPFDARYRFTLHVAAHNSDVPIVYGVYLGAGSQQSPATLFQYFEAAPGPIAPQKFEAFLAKGHTLRIFVRNLGNSNNPRDAAEAAKRRALAIAKFEVEGPLLEEWPRRGQSLRFGDLPVEDLGDPKHRKEKWYKPKYGVVSKDPAKDAARVLPAFVQAAFRRPVAAQEVEPFVALAQAELAAGASFDSALRTAQIAVLSSPEFLYLLEPPGKLDDHAVASRLSYMLWGTLPDDELLSLAAKGQLTKPDVLRAQTERLLKDPRGRQFVLNFVNQWLNLREIDFTTPDRQLYPEFDDLLKVAMVAETELFFTEVLRKNLSLLDFVDSDWTMLNDRLATHYGIDGVQGIEMRRVALKPEHDRGGVLAQAAVLKVSANGTTTSPVVRGAWVLQRILGFDPPPPPPGVPGVEPDIRGATTLREMLDKHRSTESCNNCHKTIDPPGFALESYDVIGGRRTFYRSLGKDFPSPKREQSGGRAVSWRIGPPVDPSGETADGRKFADLADYKKILLADPRTIARALTVKLATYGSGRGMEFSDRAEIDRIVAVVTKKDYGFRELVHEVIQSKLFLSK